MDEADRLVGGSAARPRHARDGCRQIRRGVFERSFRHGECNLPADGAELRNYRPTNIEQFGFRFIGVGDETALEDVR